MYQTLHVCFFSADTDNKVAELSRQLKEEKMERKSLSSKLTAMEEELSDAKTERDTLEKVSHIMRSKFGFSCLIY